MNRPVQLTLGVLMCATIALSSELTITPPGTPVGPQPTLTGKAPSIDSKVFLVVNPTRTPQQFWVQKMAKVDGKKNWICSIHIGDPGSAHAGQQFVVVAVSDPDQMLHEGDVLSDWPAAKFVSQPVTLTRK